MTLTHLSVLGVVLATLTAWGVGAIWYSPVAFSERWMALNGFKKEQLMANMKQAMFGGFAVCVLQAVIIGFLLSIFRPAGLWELSEFCLLVWGSTALPIFLNHLVYEQKPRELVLINAGYSLLAFLLSAAVTMAVS